MKLVQITLINVRDIEFSEMTFVYTYMYNNALLKKTVTALVSHIVFCSRMKVIQLDVTSKKQIEDALVYITEQLNGKGMDKI